MRASGGARASSCSPHRAQLLEGLIFGVFHHQTAWRDKYGPGASGVTSSAHSKAKGFGPAWDSTPRLANHNSLRCTQSSSWSGRLSFVRPCPLQARWREGRGQRREMRGWQAPGPGLGAAPGSMRASGRARACSCSPMRAQRL